MDSQKLIYSALVLIFLASFASKLYFVTGEPLIYNNDAGYYVEHIREVLTQGYPDVSDPPLAFYYAGAFSAVFGIMLGFKIAISLASAGIAFPVFLLARRMGARAEIALLAAFLAAFSPTNMLMMGDLLKNEVGLFFGAWFVYFVIRASDGFSMRDAGLTALFAILMVGSHFSSGAYTILAISPFLLLKPVLEWKDGSRLSKESLFCLALLLALFACGAALAVAKGMVGGGGVGVIGLFGKWGIDTSIFSLYAFFLLPAYLGLIRLERERALLLAPWLAVTFLLTQPFFTDPAFQFRFAWNAYVPIAILAACGVGYFWENKRARAGAALILSAYAIAGFVQFGESISPIIYEEEWNGLLKLHSERPDIVFTGIEGGMKQWVEAAGFEIAERDRPGAYLLVCDAAGRGENEWYRGACGMSGGILENGQEIPAIARFGRFSVLRADAVRILPEERVW